jgi:hypothetical protein
MKGAHRDFSKTAGLADLGLVLCFIKKGTTCDGEVICLFIERMGTKCEIFKKAWILSTP